MSSTRNDALRQYIRELAVLEYFVVLRLNTLVNGYDGLITSSKFRALRWLITNWREHQQKAVLARLQS
jgi:hypothetical protein